MVPARRPEGRTGDDSARAGQALVWGTYLGGSDLDDLMAAALDASGNIIVAGYSESSDIPAPGGYDAAYAGSDDDYVAKVSSDGRSLLWATYIGGAALDQVLSVAADASGNVVVGGLTGSTDMPVTGGYAPVYKGGSTDGYLAKLSAGGNQLLWGSYFGGQAADYVNAVALDAAGNAVMAGFTYSWDLPTPGGYDTVANDIDGFVAKLSADGSRLLWGTYLGGSGGDRLTALALDAAGNVVVGGFSNSADAPVPGGYDTALKGGVDAYVAKLSADGHQLLWGTYLGGSGSESVYALALDAAASVVAGGYTESADFPVPGGFQIQHHAGAVDGFVAKLAADGSRLLWGTYAGGSAADDIFALNVDASGNVAAAGLTYSSDMPVSGGFHNAPFGGQDGYLAKISSDGTSLLWGTYFGGTGEDALLALAEDGAGNIFAAGYTSSTDIPAAGGFDAAYGGAFDGCIARLTDPSMAGQAPQADFTYAPAFPVAGQMIQFTDLSTGAPASWAWDFGDGGTDAGQNPRHAFAIPGTRSVTLTASNGNGSSTKTRSVAVADSTNLYRILIPAAAHASGAAGTNWRTDAAFLDFSSEGMQCTLSLLKAGADNSFPQQIAFPLGSGQSLGFDDILMGQYGFTGAAALSAVCTGTGLLVNSRTYNDLTAEGKGTFGQNVPGFAESELFGVQETAMVLQLHKNSRYRTNLGFASISTQPIDLTVWLFSNAGVPLGTQTATLPPYGYTQINDIFGAVGAGDITNGYAMIYSTSDWAKYMAYASAIDNPSGDPVFISARR
jgi:PKD repeat protein